MSDMVNVGIIGTGVGVRTHLPAFQANPDARVLAIAGSDLQRTVDVAKKHDVRFALSPRDICTHPNVDLVCVTSPNSFHFEQAKLALEFGKHVLCEKPLTLTLAEGQELIDIASRCPTQLALVNHQLRFNPYLQETKRLIEAGRIGRPYFVKVHQQSTAFSDPRAAWSWSFDASQGGGVRLAMGSHLIDLLLSWFGSEAVVTSAALDPVIGQRTNATGRSVGVRASSFFASSLKFSGGPSAQISATAAAFTAPRFEFSIFGDGGELHFDLEHKLRGALDGKREYCKEIFVANVSKPERDNRVSIFSGSFPYFAEKIVQALRTSTWESIDPAARFEDAQNTQALLEAAYNKANFDTGLDFKDSSNNEYCM